MVTTVISVQAQFLTDDTMMRVEKTRITPETIRIKTEEKKRNQVSRLLRRSHINVDTTPRIHSLQWRDIINSKIRFFSIR